MSGFLDLAVKKGVYPMKQFPLLSLLVILALSTPAMGGVEVPVTATSWISVKVMFR